MVILQCRLFSSLNKIIENVLVSSLVSSNSFFILLLAIFLTENMIVLCSCLKLFKKFPLPNKTSTFPGIACIILYHLNPDAFILSSNNSNILHIWVWLWWHKTGFYWGISVFCQEVFKIMNCLHLCARKFALETNVKSVQTIYILRSMSFWNNQNCILGTGDETQHNDCKPTHLLKFDFVKLIL